ncbi:hypothetical protein [Nonlabens marinus]|uniref:Outer membrane protein beta-barrel domain-containing protein n=1 Tax=Nonlabens marinus S1-08 TaxID=1454201 RepID=W8VWL3_9FLAO|nr:hypothetical protein [Nonlabens marinus]BAO54837.1 hypothetical protein NMS_0828 [Nonlabens marinus S1-08]
MKSYLPFIFLVFALLQTSAQRFSANINRLGIGADATFLQLESDAILSQTSTGFAAYLESRGEMSRSFDVIYSIGIFNHNLELQEFATDETIETNLLGAEVKFLFAFRPLGNEYLTIEAGPALMINGEFKIDEVDQNKFIGSDTPIAITEFEKTTLINLNGVAGLSAGTNNIRLTAHYHYAFFDALDGMDTTDNELEGKLSYLSAGVRVYF